MERNNKPEEKERKDKIKDRSGKDKEKRIRTTSPPEGLFVVELQVLRLKLLLKI